MGDGSVGRATASRGFLRQVPLARPEGFVMGYLPGDRLRTKMAEEKDAEGTGRIVIGVPRRRRCA